MVRVPGLARRLLRRAATMATAAVLVSAVLGASATPAFAHGGGPDDTNYRSVILSPGMDGLEWTMYGGDSLLELTNHTGRLVVIEGYDKEPYLRFVPGDGVYENVHSPATYYNDDRYADVRLPPEADATLTPEWRKVASGDTHAWHDHRAHWMSPVPPSPVFNEPSKDQRVFTWVIPLDVTSDGSTHVVQVTGELWWIAPVPWWPPVLAVGVVFLGVAVLAIARSRPHGADWPGLARPVMWLVVGLAAANIVLTVDSVIASPTALGRNLPFVTSTAVAVLVILALVRHARTGEPTGFAALAGAGIAVFLIFGVDHSSELSSSQLLTELPYWVRRWTAAANLAIILPVATVVARYGFHLFHHLQQHPLTFRRQAAAGAAANEVEAG